MIVPSANQRLANSGLRTLGGEASPTIVVAQAATEPFGGNTARTYMNQKASEEDRKIPLSPLPGRFLSQYGAKGRTGFARMTPDKRNMPQQLRLRGGLPQHHSVDCNRKCNQSECDRNSDSPFPSGRFMAENFTFVVPRSPKFFANDGLVFYRSTHMSIQTVSATLNCMCRSRQPLVHKLAPAAEADLPGC